jgi:hypothetical protein
MLPVPRKSSKILSRQRFFIAALSLETAAGDGSQHAVTSKTLLLKPKRADSAYTDQPLSAAQPSLGRQRFHSSRFAAQMTRVVATRICRARVAGLPNRSEDSTGLLDQGEQSYPM